MRLHRTSLAVAAFGLCALSLAGSARQQERDKDGCRQVQRTVTPVTASYKTRFEAESDAKRQAERMCGPQGVADMPLGSSCWDHGSDSIQILDGKVVGKEHHPEWTCAPITRCVETEKRCDKDEPQAPAPPAKE